jgi:Amt family ammonium transporter
MTTPLQTASALNPSADIVVGVNAFFLIFAVSTLGLCCAASLMSNLLAGSRYLEQHTTLLDESRSAYGCVYRPSRHGLHIHDLQPRVIHGRVRCCRFHFCSPQTSFRMFYVAEAFPPLSLRTTIVRNVFSFLTHCRSVTLTIQGSLVIMMQVGFAMLCAGSVRQKNVKNILLKNVLDSFGGALGFYCFGYGFAYGPGHGDALTTFLGTSQFGLRGLGLEKYAFFFFEYSIATSAATIVAGTVAERCQMIAYLCYSMVLTGFVYPVIAHSVWDTHGFLTASRPDSFLGIGFIDFAGSGCVHLTGGASALVAAVVLGPRIGRFYDRLGNALEKPGVFPPNNVALQLCGVFLLWFGWYGFNCGSTLVIASVNSAKASSLAAVSTTMAGAAGCISALFTESAIAFYETGEISYDITTAMNGVLSGLVAITAGCAIVTPWAGILIGVVSGWIYVGLSKLLIKLKIDDAVDAIPVHFGSGAWGCIAVGFFARKDLIEIAGYPNTGGRQGWFYTWPTGSDANLLGAQICGVLWIITWVFIVMGPYFYILNIMGLYRVDAIDEGVGLDISHHRGPAYDLSEPSKEELADFYDRLKPALMHEETPETEEKIEAEDAA